MLRLLGWLLALVFLVSAMAMEFTVETALDGHLYVQASGPIEDGDAELLIEITRQIGQHDYNRRYLALASEGGVVRAAIQLGEALHALDYGTIVLDGDECLSACASVVFMSGVTREVHGSGLLGFHSCMDPATGIAVPACGDYLSNQALFRGSFEYGSLFMFMHGYSLRDDRDFIYLNSYDARCWGITQYYLQPFRPSSCSVVSVMTMVKMMANIDQFRELHALCPPLPESQSVAVAAAVHFLPKSRAEEEDPIGVWDDADLGWMRNCLHVLLAGTLPKLALASAHSSETGITDLEDWTLYPVMDGALLRKFVYYGDVGNIVADLYCEVGRPGLVLTIIPVIPEVLLEQMHLVLRSMGDVDRPVSPVVTNTGLYQIRLDARDADYFLNGAMDAVLQVGGTDLPVQFREPQAEAWEAPVADTLLDNCLGRFLPSPAVVP